MKEFRSLIFYRRFQFGFRIWIKQPTYFPSNLDFSFNPTSAYRQITILNRFQIFWWIYED